MQKGEISRMTSETGWIVEPFCKMGIITVNELFDGDTMISDLGKLSLTFLVSIWMDTQHSVSNRCLLR